MPETVRLKSIDWASKNSQNKHKTNVSIDSWKWKEIAIVCSCFCRIFLFFLLVRRFNPLAMTNDDLVTNGTTMCAYLYVYVLSYGFADLNCYSLITNLQFSLSENFKNQFNKFQIRLIANKPEINIHGMRQVYRIFCVRILTSARTLLMLRYFLVRSACIVFLSILLPWFYDELQWECTIHVSRGKYTWILFILWFPSSEYWCIRDAIAVVIFKFIQLNQHVSASHMHMFKLWMWREMQ